MKPMETGKQYRSQDWGNKLFAWGKYLVPRSVLLPSAKRVVAPKTFVSISNIAINGLHQERSEEDSKISYASFADATFFPDAEVRSFKQGQVEPLPVPALHFQAGRLYEIPDGHCVGRNGCLMDGHGNAIQETGFMYKPGVIHERKFQSWDPRHWKHVRRGNLTARKWIPAPQKLPGVSFSLNNCSTHNFYHWLLEIAPRVLAAQYCERHVDYYIVDHQKSYQKEVLQLLGTRPEQWVQPHCNLNLKCDTLLWCNEPCERLLHGFANQIKRSSHQAMQPSDDAMGNAVGNEYDQTIGKPTSANRKVYVTRRNASHRKLRNEREVETLLHSRGFETFDFDQLSFRRQIELMGEVSHLVAIHGAALANTAFAPAGAKIIELVPAGRGNYYLYPNQSRVFGHQHCIIQTASSRFRQWLKCPLADLEAALDAIDG